MGKIYTAFAFLHSDKFAIFLLFPSASSHPTSELSITPRSLPCDGGNREKYKGWNIGELCQIHNHNLILSCSFWLISAGFKNWGTSKETIFSSFIFYNNVYSRTCITTHIAKGKHGKQHQSLEKLVGINLKDFC